MTRAQRINARQDAIFERAKALANAKRDIAPFTDRELKLRGLLQKAIRDWPQFDLPDESVSGADLVEWFELWRREAIDAVYEK